VRPNSVFVLRDLGVGHHEFRVLHHLLRAFL